MAELPLDGMTNPVTGEPGVRVRFLDGDGTELFTEDRPVQPLVWFGGDAPIGRSAVVELITRYTPAESGPVRLGFAAVGHGRVYVDGELRPRRGASRRSASTSARPCSTRPARPPSHADRRDAGRPAVRVRPARPHEDSWPARCRCQFGTEPDAVT